MFGEYFDIVKKKIELIIVLYIYLTLVKLHIKNTFHIYQLM